MAWITRGLREGMVTTRYPRRPDGYGPTFRASARVITTSAGDALADPSVNEAIAACPTRAITADVSGVRLDRGRCITCGRCVERAPDFFAFDTSPEVAVLGRHMLVVPERDGSEGEVAVLRAELSSRVRALRRSVHLRHIDCGSDGSEEWEIAALTNPIYDVQRLGLYFTASPRHADVLLVTGAGALGMTSPLRTTFESMPSPKIVIGVGTDALSGGLFADTYATSGGIGEELPLDVFVPGSPPSPFAILHGILLGIGLMPSAGDR
jgi:Ni,Fe-hydrogenase III small subunit/ferredoxin